MMGKSEGQAPLWLCQINLNERVRAEHPLRRINAVLDLSFVRQEVAHTYGRRGNKSVPPEVILRMMLLLFLEDIKSERELMRTIAERLDYMWFLGYGLEDSIPDHSVLSKARKRWGQEVFHSLFCRVLQQCVKAGLVEGKKIHVDASLVDANASLQSVKALAPEVVEAIAQTARQQTAKLEEPEELEEPDKPEDQPPAAPGGAAPGGPQPGKYAKTNNRFRSTTDPDATLVRRDGGGSRLRYKSHRVVDDCHEIITAVESTTGALDEGTRLFALIAAHQLNTASMVNTAIADARYGTAANLIECQKAQIRPHLNPLADATQQKGSRAGIYPEEHFSYEPQSDTYRCPAGQLMRPRRLHSQRQTWEYVTSKGACLRCALRQLCTRSRTGRTIHRHRDQALLDEARSVASSPEAKADLKRRQHLIERSFADAANCHGFKRARWRALWKQAIQDLLIATVQNLRKLLRHLPQPTSQPTQPCLEVLQSLCHLLRKLSPLLQGRPTAFCPI